MQTFPVSQGPRGLQPVLALALALLAVFACAESEPVPDQGGTGSAKEPATQAETEVPGSSAGQEEARARTARIDPALSEIPDVGLGEVRRYRIRGVFEGEGEAPFVARTLRSSCSCLSGKVIGEPDETGVDIEVTIDGMELEDIDGVLELLGEDREVLGEHVSRLKVSSRLFVQPREVEMNPGDREVRILVGCGFTRKDTDKQLIIDDFVFDESKLALEDLIPEERVEVEYLLKTETFVLSLSDTVFEEAGETIFELRVAQPSEQTFRIPIRWPARQGD